MPARRGAKVGGRSRGNKLDDLSNVYTRKDMAKWQHQFEQQAKHQIDQLSEQIAALSMSKGKKRTKKSEDEVGEDEEVSMGDDSSDSSSDSAKEEKHDSGRWEARMRTEIPEFYGGIQPEEFLDWLGVVEEIFELKEVPEKKRVSLIATRLRGHASAWWLQLKKQRVRQGKKKITSWDKMKKHMRAVFLPPNLTRLIYQQLQNIRQGLRNVTDYSTEFYQLVARNDLSETDEQLVARYIGGLQCQFQDVVNMFDLCTIAEAHARAIQLEKQMGRRTTGGNMGFANGTNAWNGASSSAPPKVVASHVPPRPGNGGQPAKAMSSKGRRPGMKCFNCGEPGHKMSDCKKDGRVNKELFIENDNSQYEFTPIEGDAGYDESYEDLVGEEVVYGDDGQLLVVRRACLTPCNVEGDGWLRTNIFQSTCTVGGKVCKMIIDSGSCENVISEEAVAKLGLETQTHPQPYKLSWLQKGNEVTVSKRVYVSFSIGTNYKDRLWCVVVAMDACHMLLGRPWQFERGVMHDGRKNTYSFMFNNI
ncbi:uncharacterized protein LOC133718811 [Rosa rugosa]|uniref:uncharacterized protein LOC133718811 n=1 Tax=Rosa rugosa TaxID=74645 RepID=UPI002B4046E2|nr:uncharacterized protein LOC133718811 [Rosa rugosa]